MEETVTPMPRNCVPICSAPPGVRVTAWREYPSVPALAMLLPVTCRPVCCAAREEPPTDNAPIKLKRILYKKPAMNRRSSCHFQQMNTVHGGLAAVTHVQARVLCQAGNHFQYPGETFHH